MNSKDLKKALENTQNRFEVLADSQLVAKYTISVSQLMDLISEFLSDSEKLNLLDTEIFKRQNVSIKMQIVKLINDDKIKMQIFNNEEILSQIQNYQIIEIISTMSDEGKISILQNHEFIEQRNLQSYEKTKILSSLSKDNLKNILEDKNHISTNLKLETFQIKEVVSLLESEDDKISMMQEYEFKPYEMIDVLKSFSDEKKRDILLSEEYEFNRGDIEKLISTLSGNELIKFLRENKEYINSNELAYYSIVKHLDKNMQLELVSNIEDMDLTLEEKRQILVILKKETKEEIDSSKYSEEYLSALQLNVSEDFGKIGTYGKIEIDLNSDLQKYAGLDPLISLYPMDVSTEDRSKLFELCEICPKIKINDGLGLTSSTTKEYLAAETWIDSVLEGVNPEWTQLQIVAYIDNAIGKRVSYSPDFDTEASDAAAARALWKILDSGYGVCNGISQIEKYMLDKVGVESELVSTGRHAFLKLKNIQVQTENGEIVGDTIIDPTWNLTAHRYGAKPENFCKSYEEIRKNDIREDGSDACCHKNDEDLETATLNIDEQYMRNVFKSIGLADVDGSFPIKDLIDKAEKIASTDLPLEVKIKEQFEALKQYCPEFATCQNSTTTILQGISLNQEDMRFNKCVVNRVYDREDENKEAVMYVYVDSDEIGKKFYYASKEQSDFIEMDQKEFESKFECYATDMERQEGKRPWETSQKQVVVEDLTRSSGKIVAQEGDER